MTEWSMSRFLAPSLLFSASMAALSGVVLSLATLWIAAIPPQTHSVVLQFEGCCYSKQADEIESHTVLVDSNGSVFWDGHALPGRAWMEAQLRTVGALPLELQPVVIVKPDLNASYGSYIAVIAAAQRNGVQKIGLIGEFRGEVITTTPPRYWPID